MFCDNCMNCPYYSTSELGVVISCELKVPIECTQGKLPKELRELDIEFISLPKDYMRSEIIDISNENKEPKEYKARKIDRETGKVIAEGIMNSKGEYKWND